MRLKSNVKMIARDSEGNVIDTFEDHNTDLAEGRRTSVYRLAGIDPSFLPFTEIAVGQDGAAITDADVGLGLTTVRGASGTPTITTTTTTEDTFNLTVVIPFVGGGTIMKAGLFRSGSSYQTQGMGFCSLITPNIAMPANSALTVTWTVQQT